MPAGQDTQAVESQLSPTIHGSGAYDLPYSFFFGDERVPRVLIIPDLSSQLQRDLI
jgi:hypothetical protein